MKNIAETPHKTETRIDYETEYNKLRLEVDVLSNKFSLEIETLNAKLQWYEEQFRLLQHKKYGKSSEKTDAKQVSLFDEAEKESDPKIPEPTYEEITYKRRKQKGHREKMMVDLPVERVEYTLSEEELVCDKGHGSLHKMSEDIRRELKIIPAQVVVVEHVKHVYSCRLCEKEGIEVPVITAEAPNPVLNNSFVSPSLMAFVMSRKYEEGLPLYRQEQQFKHYGIDISRQTLANWMISGALRWLVHLYDSMHEHLTSLDVIHADETEVQVLKEEGRSASSKSYMWHYGSGHTDIPIALYEYQTTRARKHPQAFLEGFKGYIHTDGYQVYEDIPDSIIVGCWAHARRLFYDAIKSLDKTIEEVSNTKCSEGLRFCDKLFSIEKELSKLTPEERHQERQVTLKPIMEDFFVWLKETKKVALPKSSLGKAVGYCLNQQEKLKNVLLDGRLEISNNRAERNIRPFVVGRKGWLFCCTPKGAKASAIIYSIVITAKLNGLSPFKYLNYIFEKMPNMDISNPDKIKELLPWSNELPDHCKSGKTSVDN